MAYFATEYTIHFDDTMAYGSHHFLTGFKFQCASREAFLFGERVFDVAGVKEVLDQVHLLTSDAYSRNLGPARLGDRLVILLTLEDWGRASARFCYRVINAQGQPICAGYQTLICADAETQLPIPIPGPLQEAMDTMREIEEPHAKLSFQERVLAGGSKLDSLFGDAELELARSYLSERYPSPAVLEVLQPAEVNVSGTPESVEDAPPELEAWVFAGQAAFDARLLSHRVDACLQRFPAMREELARCAALASSQLGGDAAGLLSGNVEQCIASVKTTPALSQVAIHLQNVLGAQIWQANGAQPSVVMGHSFGEIAALGVSGCFDLITGVRIVCMRVQAIADYAPQGTGLMVVACDRSRATTEAQLLGLDQVVVAGRNHDAQTLMSGSLQQLEQLKACLARQSITATLIPSPTGFHHPGLQQAAESWLAQLRTLELLPSELLVYSPVGRRFLGEGEDIAAILAGQLVRPFDLQGAVADTIQNGVTKFVDCGSTGILARLLENSTGEGAEVCVVDSDEASFNSVQHVERSAPPEGMAPNRASPSRTARAADGVEENAVKIAVVAHGCILPGGAKSPEQLYAAIVEQRMGIVDQSKFDPHWLADFYSEELRPDRSTSPLTGRVNDADIAVPDGVDVGLFDQFSRTQKLLCIALAPCIASLEGAERIMCLVGATADGFEDQDEMSSLRFAGIDPSEPRIRQELNLALSACEDPHGAVQEVFDRMIRPGLEVTLVDAACASSLYTVALGMQALETGKADAVLAGGFFCPGPGNNCLFSQFRGTTSTGCRPFDAGADGVVFSEGAALVTLRRLDDAQRNGLDIKATVLGAGLSSDGKSSSANVPQTRGQLFSLKRCYSNYQIDPGSITAIEGHGTSTPVGDSTELDTLCEFFSDHVEQPIPLHSLKGLLGHAGWAAGTASIIAVCEYMRHGMFPGQATHRSPSEALEKAAGTLVVGAAPTHLTRDGGRIAIDGFGFGGANAHMVLEAPSRSLHSGNEQAVQSLATRQESELVFVACHQETADDIGDGVPRFSRSGTQISNQYIVLPELADDMDISQTLAVNLADRLVGKIPGFDGELREKTSLVLAMSGKTQRGVEATMRVLTPRFRRGLAGDAEALGRLESAFDAARPSGAYTLQCMMPNVASGRAALLLNLNGPNFVVDAGDRSLESAMESAELLLNSGQDGGTQLAIVGAIGANSSPGFYYSAAGPTPEYAAAFAVTTRIFAEREKMPILSSVRTAMDEAIGIETELPPHQKVRRLMGVLDGTGCCSTKQKGACSTPEVVRGQTVTRAVPGKSSAPEPAQSDNDDCRIFNPVWVESAPTPKQESPVARLANKLLVLVSGEYAGVDQLFGVLPAFCDQFLIAYASADETEEACLTRRDGVVRIDLDSNQRSPEAWSEIEGFDADLILVLDEVTSWDRGEVLAGLATDNALCELLFLVSQRYISKLESAGVEIWGLVVGGWDGAVHPASGPIAGFLKSAGREYPRARTGTICTCGIGLEDALSRLRFERHDGALEQEVVYDSDLRLVRRLRPDSSAGPTSDGVKLDQRSVVVATGGAKGVTAVLLEALLQDYGCTVIAIGRSPLEAGPVGLTDAEMEKEFYAKYLRENPGASVREMQARFQAVRSSWEAHQAIQDLSSLGGRVEYVAADVTDPQAIHAVLADVVAQHGKIDLFLHGAGVQKSKKLKDRSLADFRLTFSIKVCGLHNLQDSSRKLIGHPVSTHVLTSAYSVFGNDGQHDYGAANETLDRLCDLNAASSSEAWSSIAWLAWAGIGMTRGSEYTALAKSRRLSGVDRRLGQKLFRQVINGSTGSAINVPISSAEHVEYSVRTIPAAATVRSEKRLEQRVALAGFDCLPYHKVRGVPTLPGSWILDLMVTSGLELLSPEDRSKVLTIEDIAFARFVRLAKGQEPNIRVVAEQSGSVIHVWMLTDILHPTGAVLQADVICASARLQVGLPVPESSIAWTRQESGGSYLPDPYCRDRREVSLSGPFDCLSEIEIGAESRRAKFIGSHSLDSAQTLPALLLDAAWRVGAMYATGGSDDVFVPIRVGKVTLWPDQDAAGDEPNRYEIRSLSPRPCEKQVHWERTEVLNSAGRLRILVEHASATELG